MKGVGWYCHSATPVKIWIEEILLWFGCCSLDVEGETATPVEIWIEEFLVDIGHSGSHSRAIARTGKENLILRGRKSVS